MPVRLSWFAGCPVYRVRDAKASTGSGIVCFWDAGTTFPDVVASCDIAALPSKAEGLPNAVLEPMGGGCRKS